MVNWNFLKRTYELNPESALRVLSQLRINLEDRINTTQMSLDGY